MEISPYVMRTYVRRRPYSTETDPLGIQDCGSLQNSAPLGDKYGSVDDAIVTLSDSMELCQEPHTVRDEGVRVTNVATPIGRQCSHHCTSSALETRSRRPDDPLDHTQSADGQKFSCDPTVQSGIRNPIRTDCAENRSDDECKRNVDIMRYLQKIKSPAPQIMRRFILTFMEKKVTEKDLLWMYQMRDHQQNGTLPQNIFLCITKQHLPQNSQLIHDRDYEILAESYLGFDGNFVRYVDLCNDLHTWRVLCNNYREFPLLQIYPPYRYPQTENYPRPPQGDWHLDMPRRESHQLPTVTLDELRSIPELVKRISEALYQNHRFDTLEKKFHELEKQKEGKNVECGLVPHDYVQKVLEQFIPLDMDDKKIESLCLFYEHPFILHFFRYGDFLLDIKFETALINPKLKETQNDTRKRSMMAILKRHIHNEGLDLMEAFKDFDTLNEGRLNFSLIKRALHVLRVGPGQRCHVSDQDMDFLLGHFSDNGQTINYRTLSGELTQVFVERFEPGGRLAMVLESFERNLSRGPYYPPHASLMSKEEILKKIVTDEDLLRNVIDRLKMLVVERRVHIQPIFRVFDPHNIGYVQNVLTFARIMQLAALPVTPVEVTLLIEKFADKKGFRYQEFLQAIDTQSYVFHLPTYPVTLATMEEWKNKRAWFAEVTPQNVFQNYQGPELITDKCRRKVLLDRLNVIDFFRDYDIHNRGLISRKQFRRATAAMGFNLSPIENLILENRYACKRDIACLDYTKFVTDMDVVFAPKDVSSHPAKIPDDYKLSKVNDRQPIGSVQVALAQEGFRKLCEKLLELRIHIEPYFEDFDPWRRGGITQERFRRVINALNIDVLSEVQWRALFKYFARPSQKYFDYRAFLDKVADVEKRRERNVVDDPRFGSLRGR